ncbi:hypothetical protein EYC80_003031 [Monilinia laxa]|uniref:Uncharacterized protein n=1 Tax=Monilinia laxa TaxID=61186 RepID=A0A5N6KCG5_MONLA|nr:hypothetical protein EYC80_003031 [Monilinia laxa]
MLELGIGLGVLHRRRYTLWSIAEVIRYVHVQGQPFLLVPTVSNSDLICSNILVAEHFCVYSISFYCVSSTLCIHLTMKQKLALATRVCSHNRQIIAHLAITLLSR